jgi:hypothetical protein
MAHLATSFTPHFPPAAFLHPAASSCLVSTRVKSGCHPIPSYQRWILLQDQVLVVNRRHLGIRYERKNNDSNNEDENVVISIVDRFASILAKPTPGIPDLALGYPLTLLGAAAIVPATTSVLLAAFFGVFSFVGRRFVLDDLDDDGEEEEDRPNIDFLALGAAVASAGILSPGDNLDVGDFPPLGVLIAAVALGAVAMALPSDARLTAEESPDQSIMNLWDEQLEKENRK